MSNKENHSEKVQSFACKGKDATVKNIKETFEIIDS